MGWVSALDWVFWKDLFEEGPLSDISVKGKTGRSCHEWERGSRFEEIKGPPTPCDGKAVLWRWLRRDQRSMGQRPDHAESRRWGPVLIHISTSFNSYFCILKL